MIPVQVSADSTKMSPERGISSAAPEVASAYSHFDAKYYSSIPDCDASRIQSFQRSVFGRSEHSQAELNFDFEASIFMEKIAVNFRAELAQNEMREVKFQAEGLMHQSSDPNLDEHIKVEAYVVPIVGEDAGFDVYYREIEDKSDGRDLTSGHNQIAGTDYSQAMLAKDLLRLDLERLLKELPYKIETSDTDEDQITILLPVKKLIDFGEAEYLRYEFDESLRDEATSLCELARRWTERFEQDAQISELVLPLRVRFSRAERILAIEFDWTELSPALVEFLAKTFKAPEARFVRVKSFIFNLALDHPTKPIEINVPAQLRQLKNE